MLLLLHITTRRTYRYCNLALIVKHSLRRLATLTVVTIRLFSLV